MPRLVALGGIDASAAARASGAARRRHRNSLTRMYEIGNCSVKVAAYIEITTRQNRIGKTTEIFHAHEYTVRAFSRCGARHGVPARAGTRENHQDTIVRFRRSPDVVRQLGQRRRRWLAPALVQKHRRVHEVSQSR